MMLIGEYESQITAGNRTALPKKFREELGEKLILARGYEGCLLLMSQERWQEMIEGTVSGPFVAESIRQTSRFLLAGAHEVIPDSQGRIVLPSSLMSFAHLKSKVIFLGLGRWVEVWDEGAWREQEKYLQDQGAVIAEKLVKLSA